MAVTAVLCLAAAVSWARSARLRHRVWRALDASDADDGATDPMSLTLSNEVELLLNHGLDELNDREREVVAGRYGLGDREPETLEVLAARLGLTRERIRQIQQEALVKLRRRMLRQGVDRDSIF